MSSAYTNFERAKWDLREALEYLANPMFDYDDGRETVRNALRDLVECEMELAESDPFRLPEKPSEALKKRAAELLSKTAKKKRAAKTVTLSVTIPSAIANDLRIFGNGLCKKAGYDDMDFVSPDEAAAVIVEAYLKNKIAYGDTMIPYSVLKEIAIARKCLPPHNLTESQKKRARKLFDERGLSWKEAVTEVLGGKVKCCDGRKGSRSES